MTRRDIRIYTKGTLSPSLENGYSSQIPQTHDISLLVRLLQNFWYMLSPQLPHLQPVLVAFFKGALITFERFTSEFAPGSPIDLASATEKELAWMPPTNDVNEGALGSYRIYIRKKPTITVQQYNALTMFNFNYTEEWMDKEFTAEDLVTNGLWEKRERIMITVRRGLGKC